MPEGVAMCPDWYLKRSGGSVDRWLTQAQNQALRRSASLQELRELNLHHAEAARLQLRGKLRADLVQENRAAHVDGVAGEAEGVGFVDSDAFRLWIMRLDQGAR